MGTKEFEDFTNNKCDNILENIMSDVALAAALEVAGKTIGFDLVGISTEALEEVEIPDEPKHPVDEHWEPFYRHTREEFDPYNPDDFAKLDEEDVKILDKFFNFDNKSEIVEGKYGKYDKYTRQGYWNCWLIGRHLHISSPESAWMSLAGRHFVYDLTTKKYECIEMN